MPPPQWPDVPLRAGELGAPRLAEEPGVRKPPEAALAAEPLREERSDATGVSQRRRAGG